MRNKARIVSDLYENEDPKKIAIWLLKHTDTLSKMYGNNIYNVGDYWDELEGEYFKTEKEFNDRVSELTVKLGNIFKMCQGEVKIYRDIAVTEPDEVASVIEQTGKPGDYWAYKESGAGVYVGEEGGALMKDRSTIRIEATVSGESIDPIAMLVQNLLFPNESEIIVHSEDITITNMKCDDFKKVWDREIPSKIVPAAPYTLDNPGARYNIVQRIYENGEKPWEKIQSMDDVFAINKEIREEERKAKEKGESKGSGKGRGWWGDSDGHSKAAKKRSDFDKEKDLCNVDMNERIREFGKEIGERRGIDSREGEKIAKIIFQRYDRGKKK